MASKLNAAVIGCGVIAPDHIKGYQRCPDVGVSWVCDLVSERANRRTAEFGIPRSTLDYREILADPSVDCVSVCTDHAAHVTIVCEALAAGKHVLCEKALAAGRDGLDRMFTTAAKHPEALFGAVFQHRFDPVYRLLKKLVEEKAFGPILTASMRLCCLRTPAYYASDAWRGTWANDGGAVLINQSIHYVDILGWIMGGIAAVGATWANITHTGCVEAEDTVAASVRFANGALGTIEAMSSSHLDWEPAISIRGATGSIDVVNAALSRAAFADKDLEKRVLGEFAACAMPEATGVGKTYYGPSHPSQLADFVEAVRNNRKPFVTAFSARHAVDVVLAIYESGREGKRIEVTSRP